MTQKNEDKTQIFQEMTQKFQKKTQISSIMTQIFQERLRKKTYYFLIFLFSNLYKFVYFQQNHITFSGSGENIVQGLVVLTLFWAGTG